MAVSHVISSKTSVQDIKNLNFMALKWLGNRRSSIEKDILVTHYLELGLERLL
jgi:hypothetical protein